MVALAEALDLRLEVPQEVGLDDLPNVLRAIALVDLDAQLAHLTLQRLLALPDLLGHGLEGSRQLADLVAPAAGSQWAEVLIVGYLEVDADASGQHAVRVVDGLLRRDPAAVRVGVADTMRRQAGGVGELTSDGTEEGTLVREGVDRVRHAAGHVGEGPGARFEALRRREPGELVPVQRVVGEAVGSRLALLGEDPQRIAVEASCGALQRVEKVAADPLERAFGGEGVEPGPSDPS